MFLVRADYGKADYPLGTCLHPNKKQFLHTIQYSIWSSYSLSKQWAAIMSCNGIVKGYSFFWIT